MKITSNIKIIAGLLIAGACFAACTNDEIVNEPHQTSVADKTYTLTVNAIKNGDEAVTRALSLDGNTLNATWSVGEEVTVYNVTKNADLTGTLTAQSSGPSTTLKGSITGIIEEGDVLKLKFLSPNYTLQTGTLEYIATNCDYAEAYVIVTDGSTLNVTATAATFINQQAIVKFTLKDKANDEALCISVLNVNDGTNTYTITPASDTDVVYVAIPGFSGQKVTLNAIVGYDTFTFEQPNVTFTNGRYYAIGVKMTKQLDYTQEASINAGSVIVPSGEHWLITGTGTRAAGNKTITIGDNAIVTLSGVDFIGDSYAIKCTGSAKIILAEKTTNTVLRGIQAGGAGTTLTIQGTGTLIVYGYNNGAGIGSGYENTCGNVTINSGTIEVHSAGLGAGIGSGSQGTCGTVTIKSGMVMSYAGASAAGIGSGYKANCGNIEISGGTITAIGGGQGTYQIIDGYGNRVNVSVPGGAGIGTGKDGNCGNITIKNTVTSVTATKGAKATNSIGIGSGSGTCGSISIEDGANVTQN